MTTVTMALPQLSRARTRVKRPQAWSRRAKVSGIAAQPSAAPGRGPGPVPCREARRKPLWWRAWAPKSLVALAGTSAAARAGSGCACQLPCPLERVLPVSAKSWFGPSSSRGRAWPRAPGAFRVGLGRLSHGHARVDGAHVNTWPNFAVPRGCMQKDSKD